ncbi:MAG: glycosyltransferase family 4 protein [Oculatellaceae cyanobacterium bins.114]|nr:glycosyltransferase family 4 protein [Oculatellaceae cyanobacterium bins.114]
MHSLSSWICCQLGAREHYAIPRALHRSNHLQQLITDAWISPYSLSDRLLANVSSRLKERFHTDLVTAAVQAFTPSLLLFEATQKLCKTRDWDRMIQRNHWFQQQTLTYLKANIHHFSPSTILFSYSYTALSLFQFAKQQGWKTVLGQIDPGPLEEQRVTREQQRYPELEPNWHPVPLHYWQTWQQECDLADQIIVNSQWSKQLLTQTNLKPHKIQVVPLVYEPPKPTQEFCRTYPTQFSRDRPLRVLFLGIITLRKGIAPLLAAIEQLKDMPIEFWFVGSSQITTPPHLRRHPRVHWIGAIPRSETYRYYQLADVFIFPTISDGFGLTQLEAQAWQLPLITSRFCGEVIENQRNGLVLPEVTEEAIVDALKTCLNHPEQLKSWSIQSGKLKGFELAQLSQRLQICQSALFT